MHCIFFKRVFSILSLTQTPKNMLKAKHKKKPTTRLCVCHFLPQSSVNFGPVLCLRAVFVSFPVCLATSFADTLNQRWPQRCERGFFVVVLSFPMAHNSAAVSWCHEKWSSNKGYIYIYTMLFLKCGNKYLIIRMYRTESSEWCSLPFPPFLSLYETMGSSRVIIIVERWTNSHSMYKVQSIPFLRMFETNDIFDLDCCETMAQFSLHKGPFLVGVRMLFAGICLHEQRRYDSWCSIDRHQKRGWHVCCGGYSFDSVTWGWTIVLMTSPVEFFYHKLPDSQTTQQWIPCRILLFPNGKRQSFRNLL